VIMEKCAHRCGVLVWRAPTGPTCRCFGEVRLEQDSRGPTEVSELLTKPPLLLSPWSHVI